MIRNSLTCRVRQTSPNNQIKHCGLNGFVVVDQRAKWVAQAELI